MCRTCCGLNREPPRSWLALLTAFCTQMFGMSSEVFFSVAYLDLMEKYGASRANVGLAISLVLSVGSVFALMCSPVIDRHGCRHTLFVGAAMASSGFFVCAWSSNIVVFHLFYGCVAGAGWIMNAHVGQTVVQQAFHQNRGLATGVCLVGLSAGQLLGAIWSRFILDTYGVGGAFLMMSAVHMQMFILTFAVPPSRKDFQIVKQSELNKTAVTKMDVLKNKAFEVEVQSSKERIPKEKVKVLNDACDVKHFGSQETNVTTKKSMKKIKLKELLSAGFLKNPKFVLYIFVRLTWLSCKYGLVHHAVAAAVYRGISNNNASYLPSIMGFVNLIMKLVSATALNIRRVNKTGYFLTGMVCHLGAALVAAFGNSLEWIILAMVLLGLNEGFSTTSQPIVVVSLIGTEAFARGFSIVNLSMVPASLISGPFYGYLADVTKGYMIPFLVASGFALIAVCLVVAIMILERRDSRLRQTTRETDEEMSTRNETSSHTITMGTESPTPPSLPAMKPSLPNTKEALPDAKPLPDTQPSQPDTKQLLSDTKLSPPDTKESLPDAKPLPEIKPSQSDTEPLLSDTKPSIPDTNRS